MSNLVTRPVTRADAPGVNDLLAAAEAVDRTEEHYNVDDVIEELDNPMIDPARDWVVVEADDGRLVAHCRLMPRAASGGELSVAIDGTVHPDFRRQGLGSRLVPAMIARAHEHVRERGDLRPVVTGTAPSTNTDLAAIFGRHGMHPERWNFVMLADPRASLSATPPELPDGYTVHTWDGIDHDEIRAVHNEAFAEHYGFTPWSAEMWGQWVSDSRALRPSLSLLARDATGTIAAYVQSAEYDAVFEATGIREAYVAKVGTTAAHRRRGLAGVLLRIALRRYAEEGYARAALDVDSENPTGALGVYEQAGFRTEQRWTNYRLGATPR